MNFRRMKRISLGLLRRRHTVYLEVLEDYATENIEKLARLRHDKAVASVRRWLVENGFVRFGHDYVNGMVWGAMLSHFNDNV